MLTLVHEDDGPRASPQVARGGTRPGPGRRDRRHQGFQAGRPDRAVRVTGPQASRALRSRGPCALARTLLAQSQSRPLDGRAAQTGARTPGAMSIYADTSCVLKLLFPEPETPRVMEI